MKKHKYICELSSLGADADNLQCHGPFHLLFNLQVMGVL